MKPFLLKQAGKWILPVLLMVAMNHVQAQSGTGIVLKKVLDGAHSQLAKDSSVTVQDSAYFDPVALDKLDTPYTVRNIITFRINEYSRLVLPANFEASARVRITYTVHGQEFSTDQDLTISYDTSNAYTMRKSFVFYNAHKVKAQVLDITANAPASVYQSLLMENEMEIHPVYKWSCTENAVKLIMNRGPLSPTDSTDELEVYWNAVTGADVYDLEWAYIDSSALNINRYGSPVNPALVFAYNTTRVTIAGNSYRIPLLYDDGGILYFRVRAVQEKRNNKRIETAWSSDFTGGMGAYSFAGHQRLLNWYSSVNFAEDGKRKVTIQYYDGSLRSRQTVTKDNTTDTTLVAETAYDYQGRPVIQVLPAPTVNNVIKFNRNLNRDINGAEYDKDHYDYLATPQDFLTASAAPMDSSSGTNRYYSGANSNKNEGLNKYIPGAGGYAFAETQYTQDNTGRVSKQGGVGPAFKIGSGHETKYFYGSAPEEDLYALFGTEVGDASHYFKNTVADANGQYSVTYLDMHGRTVATALAGTSENRSLVDLPNKTSLMVTDSLSGPGKNVIKDNVMEIHYSQTVTEDGNYHFKYLLPPPVLKKANCEGDDISYAGLFDLEIKITDDAFNQHLPNHVPFVKDTDNYRIAGVHPDVLRDPIVLEFDLYLVKGNYEITKRLTINRQGMDDYFNNYFLASNVCTSLEEEIEKQQEAIRSVSCFPDCATCKANLASWDEFRVNYVVSAGNNIQDTALYRTEAFAAYQSAVEKCKSLCDEVTETALKRKVMLQDVSPPSGQYATPSDSAHIFSIFNTHGETTPAKYQYDEIVYLDGAGQPDMVYDEVSGDLVKPQLLSPQQFAEQFKPSWAEALLRYHPEYCKLLALQGYEASELWDKRFQKVDSYAAAKDSGFLNPTNMAAVAAKFPAHSIDPLSLTQKAALESKMNNYVATSNGPTIWSFATTSIKCGKNDDGCNDKYNTVGKAFDEQALCEGDRDMAWRAFRQAYLDVKKSVMQTLIPPNDCVNETDLAGTGKTTRFPTAKGMLNQNGISTDAPDQQTAENQSSDRLQKLIEDNCKTYVNYWVQQLGACYDTAIVRSDIVPMLLQVCKDGGDLDHIMGASTVPPGRSAVYRSFEQVLTTYNASHGHIGDVLVCNTELLAVPRPYDRQPAYVDKTAFSKPSDCECSNLTNIYHEYQAFKTVADSNFSAYLFRTRKVKLSQSNLDALLATCGATGGTCSWLSQPLTIPALIQCNVAPPCATCQDVKDLFNSFKAAYPGVDTLIGGVDSLHQLGNQLFANYMNNRLGFSKQAWEYKAFMDSCDRVLVVKDTVVCTSPQQLMKIYFSGGTDAMSDILKTADGGYLMAGSSTSASAGTLGTDAYLIKTDAKGVLQWAKIYGDSGNENFTRIKPTKDGGYIAIGTTTSNNHPQRAAFMVKMDIVGNVTWARSLGYLITNSPNGEVGWDIIQLSDDRYAFSGGYNYNSGVSDWLVGVLKTDGGIGWVRRMGTGSSEPNAYLLEDNDTLVLAGTTIRGGYYDIGIVKLNKITGAYLNGIDYDMESNISNWAGGIWKTATGYRIAGLNAIEYGNDNGRIILMDVPSNGPATAKKLAPPPNRAIGWAMTPTADGGVITAQQGSATPLDIYLHKIAPDNTLTWSNIVRITGDESLTKLVQNTDGSYAGVGVHNNVAMLMRTEISGRTGCEDSIYTPAYEAIGVMQTAYPNSTNLALSLNPPSFVFNLTGRTYRPVDSIISCNTPDCRTIDNGPLLCGNAEPVFTQVDPNIISNCSDSSYIAVTAGTVRYNNIVDSVRNDFENSYTSLMLQAINKEQFAVTYGNSEYHYTLYYYDQAGNLVKTVPPGGVVKDRSANWISQVKVARAAGTRLVPAHRLPANYRYNTLNQVIAQKTPDAGISHFWYDRLGRLAVSQNAKQLGTNAYSYTLYDSLGRITEVGEISNSTAMTDGISRTAESLANWINGAAGTKKQITRTVYDQSNQILSDLNVLGAKNLRNRVAWTAVYGKGDSLLTNGYDNGTFYSYDIHGNVDTLLQDYKHGVMNDADNRWKKMSYNYDLISGKVNQVNYQAGQRDAFYHRYSYDAENRITNVATSHDSVYWENDAFYQYYKHGPLVRAVIGQQQVQGIDYAYTLQGWLKGVNSTALTSDADMGGDGSSGGGTARDAFGFSLHYFGDNEYKAINSNAFPFASATASGSGFKPLFNGNIGAMSVNLPKIGEPLLYTYGYDALNRLVSMDALKGLNTATNTWAPVAVPDFAERVSYDPNGNILGYQRKGNKTWANLPEHMDSLTYHYIAGTNQLGFVSDSVKTGNYSYDIDNQMSGNYTYDAIGNLISDKKENISNIEWTVYGKISKITKPPYFDLSYTYDAVGNRISKTMGAVTTWYVRDAGGNVMSIYSQGSDDYSNGRLSQIEVDLYGSSRLGINTRVTNMESEDNPGIALEGLGIAKFTNFSRREKFFELSNHLGNVLATVSDAKRGVSGDGSTVDRYEADVVTANDYYPFGMIMPDRNWDAGKYRYGFNGKENDNEVKGDGNQQDYGMRIYDPRAGRFLSVDPLTKEYPWNSTYAFAENDVLRNIDLDGKEKLPYIMSFSNSGKRTALDYVNAFNNAGIGFLNVPITLWNGGVETVQSVGRGTYFRDLGREFGILGPALWGKAVDVVKDPIREFTSPGAVEMATSIYMGTGKWDFSRVSSNASEFARIAGIREASINSKGVAGIGADRNVAFLEGAMEGGESYFGFSVSGRAARQEAVNLSLDGSRNYTTYRVNGRDAMWDSEIKLLEDFTEKFGTNASISGDLKLVSEITICPSCRMAIEQFKDKFPNINLKASSLMKSNPYKNAKVE